MSSSEWNKAHPEAVQAARERYKNKKNKQEGTEVVEKVEGVVEQNGHKPMAIQPFKKKPQSQGLALPEALAGRVITTPTGLRLTQGLSYDEWEDLGRYLARVDRALGWCQGDWLNEGDDLFGELTSQAKELGYAGKTLANVAWVAKRVEPSRRREKLSFAHHEAIAKLPVKDGDRLLDLAEENGWTVPRLRLAVRELKAAMSAPQKTAEIIEQSKGEVATYPVVLVVPPWYDYAHVDSVDEPTPGIEIMSVAQICKMPIGKLASRDAMVLLWCPAPLLPDGLTALSAWGFKYVTNIVRVREIDTEGFWVKGGHDHVLIGKRGEMPVPPMGLRISSMSASASTANNLEPHKVPDLYTQLEAAYPDFPKLMISAEGYTKAGWTSLNLTEEYQ